jgi:hypothetical protein
VKAKVAFLIPYIGKFPSWGHLFIESCRFNPNVDVLLLSDELNGLTVPPNIKIVRLSSREILDRLQRVTHLKLETLLPHKLCDFRPFFALAFADLISDYDFWGYCDLDMMFGRLDRLLDDAFFHNWDIFSAHSEQFVGHFTIIRNSPEINSLGFEIPNWQTLCSTFRAEHVDEERFSAVIARHPGIRWLRPLKLRLELQREFCRHAITFDFKGRIADMPKQFVAIARWHDGCAELVQNGGKATEILYVHFMGIKKPWHWPQAARVADSGAKVFSRIGYGRVRTTDELYAPRAYLLYQKQRTKSELKRIGGFIARRLLAPSAVESLKRIIKL